MPTPNIKIIPPLVYGGLFIVGWGLEQLAPAVADMGSYWPQIQNRVAYLLMGLGVMLVLSAMITFRRAETPFDVRKAASALVISGPYRVTRNPGYLALTSFHVGLAIYLGLNWSWAMVIPALLVMDRFVIPREEANLEEIFGEEYADYKSRVRRWI